MEIPSQKDIEIARKRISEVIHRTPILSSDSLNELLGAQLFLKCENFQKTGSFKIRGATNAIFYHKEKGQSIFATHSSGNHAQAVAYAAKKASSKAQIVMPENAISAKRKGVESYGGIITFCEPKEAARTSTCNEIIARENATFISPFEDPLVIAGQATTAVEVFEEIQPDILMTPVGGGGLAAGSALSTKYYSPKTRVILGEPLNADDTARSFKAGKIIPVKDPLTIADGLKVTVGALNFEIIKEVVSDVLTVTEEQIVSAMKLIWERMKIVIEPSSAVPVATVIHHPEIFTGKKIGIIVSGGNVDLNNLPFW